MISIKVYGKVTKKKKKLLTSDVNIAARAVYHQ